MRRGQSGWWPRAREFEISPNRIGMMGFSAGGHCRFDRRNPLRQRQSCGRHPIAPAARADFVILGYPVITLEMPYVHAGSARNLLGDNPIPSWSRNFPTNFMSRLKVHLRFFFTTSDDDVVPVEQRELLRRAQTRCSRGLHVFERGPHGVGLALGDPPWASGPTLLANWLRSDRNG